MWANGYIKSVVFVAATYAILTLIGTLFPPILSVETRYIVSFGWAILSKLNEE
jgi:hypothetical protein